MDIALSVAGHKPGGPAKVAVLSSGCMGMISGSTVANVVTTGTLTIPLMKKIGYTPEEAGAVETVASSGGQVTPPIMGTVAFLIADQPSRGIDVGAAKAIHQKILALRDRGTAVLLVSADLNEVMELSDSLMVFCGGEIVAYFEDTSTLTDEEMGEYMLGLKRQSPEEIRRAFHA